MYQFIKRLATTNSCNVMKSEMISKNETSLKKQTIRRNFKLTMLIFLMISSFIFVSCQEDSHPPTTLQFQNISEHPFKAWINGEYKTTVNGGSSSEKYVVDAPSGTVQVKWEQESGYFHYPLKYQDIVIVSSLGGDYLYKFPLNTNGQIKIQNNTSNNYTIQINAGVQQASVSANSTLTFDVDGWREYTVTWWLNGVFSGGTTVQVDVGYVYTVQISN